MANICSSVLAVLLISACFYVEGLSDNQDIASCKGWGVAVAKGETIPIPGQCMQATCIRPSYNKFDTLECPVYKLRAGCTLTDEDLSKPYPDCCRQPVCPEE